MRGTPNGTPRGVPFLLFIMSARLSSHSYHTMRKKRPPALCGAASNCVSAPPGLAPCWGALPAQPSRGGPPAAGARQLQALVRASMPACSHGEFECGAPLVSSSEQQPLFKKRTGPKTLRAATRPRPRGAWTHAAEQVLSRKMQGLVSAHVFHATLQPRRATPLPSSTYPHHRCRHHCRAARPPGKLATHVATEWHLRPAPRRDRPPTHTPSRQLKPTPTPKTHCPVVAPAPIIGSGEALKRRRTSQRCPCTPCPCP